MPSGGHIAMNFHAVLAPPDAAVAPPPAAAAAVGAVGSAGAASSSATSRMASRPSTDLTKAAGRHSNGEGGAQWRGDGDGVGGSDSVVRGSVSRRGGAHPHHTRIRAHTSTHPSRHRGTASRPARPRAARRTPRPPRTPPAGAGRWAPRPDTAHRTPSPLPQARLHAATRHDTTRHTARMYTTPATRCEWPT